MTSTERAVRKASGARLLRDFARASKLVRAVMLDRRNGALTVLTHAKLETSRTRYACLMTAFGQ